MSHPNAASPHRPRRWLLLWAVAAWTAGACRSPTSSPSTAATADATLGGDTVGAEDSSADGLEIGDDAAGDDAQTGDDVADSSLAETDSGDGTDSSADSSADGDGEGDAATGDAPDDTLGDASSQDVAPDPCAGIDCGGKGVCYPLYDKPICQCDVDAYRIGATQCASKATPGPCWPNPCKGPDKGLCDEVDGAAVCSCDVGFSAQNNACVFVTCPAIAATTGVTVYDQTGGTVATGFDPLVAGDVVKVRVDIAVSAGAGALELELRADNLDINLQTLTFNGKALLQPAKIKGPLLLVPLALQAGNAAIELRGTVVGGWAPLSIDARLTAPGACEIPDSRSGARIGPLGLLDAKGFGCIDLDRSHGVQIAAEIVEKSTAQYGKDNGTNSNYSPSGTIVATMTQCFTRQTARALFLAGDALGTLPFGVDNYLVIEPFDHEPTPGELPTKALILQADGVVAPAASIQKIPGPHGDVRGTHIGVPNGNMFGWSAGVVRLDELIPVGTPTWLRFYALDHGVVGRLTRVYVHARDPSEALPTCVLDSNCDHLGKGCVQGSCKGDGCVGSCGQDGIFCVQGKCSSRCDQGGGQCGAGMVCAMRQCVPAATTGVCEMVQQDKDCPLGTTCHWGICEPGCHHPRKQDQSYAQAVDFCKTPGLCPHCSLPSQGCWNNVCAACEIDAHCPSGACVDRTCVSTVTPP